ncbi:hypothetical protein PoB_003889000 [Plakobranchus ocellatus]|uniref:Secreted protein n=1 Tax=Plakobranchus ocellatus TaxID=259542 RepID=A0AAV4AVK5_9GAST|nr:hypothetical protein PoB_003889000 [Plakobranchus ocellatus]
MIIMVVMVVRVMVEPAAVMIMFIVQHFLNINKDGRCMCNSKVSSRRKVRPTFHRRQTEDEDDAETCHGRPDHPEWKTKPASLSRKIKHNSINSHLYACHNLGIP